MRTTVTFVDLYVPTCVFFCMREDRQSFRLNSKRITKHMHTDIGSVTLQLPSSRSAAQPRALPEFLTPTRVWVPLPVQPTILMPALSSYFCSSLCVRRSLSLINVKLPNNKASILSLLASSVPCMCHCDPPPPPQRPPSSFHMAAEPKPRSTLPTWKVAQQKEEGKNEEEAFLSFLVILPPFLLPSWSWGQKRMPLTFT